MKSKKYLYLLVACILFIIIIIIYGITQLNRDNISYIDNNKAIIVDRNELNDNQKIPYLNLTGTEVNTINEEISSILSNYYGSDDVFINYQYEVNGVLLSIVISIVDYNSIAAPEVIFKNYTVDLSNNHSISNDELLALYSYDKEIFKTKVYDIFNNYYYQSKITNDCNYDCFINDLNGYFNYDEDVSLFLTDNKLYVYISAHQKMEYIEYQYFDNHDFNWEVGEIYA